MANRIKDIPIPDLSQKLTPELLGQAIRAKRTEDHLNQADAAALCGVSKQTFANIEKGLATTQFNTILQVCSGLGITLLIQQWSREAEHEWR